MRAAFYGSWLCLGEAGPWRNRNGPVRQRNRLSHGSCNCAREPAAGEWRAGCGGTGMTGAERFATGMATEDAGAAALAALLASRMCHDLVSPLGAIGNGLELLEMYGAAAGPEHALIADSVAAAGARLRLFRLAFGHAGDGQRLPVAELRELLSD